MAKECEVMSKTYKEIRVIPAALRASGAMEAHGTFSETLGFYITDSLRTAAGVHIPNKEATLIINGEIITVKKKSAEIWVAGDAIFWLSGTTEFTNVNDGSGLLVGKAKIAAASGNATGDIVFKDYYPVQRGMQIGTVGIPYKITDTFPDPIISLYAKSSVLVNIEAFKVHTVLEGVSAIGDPALFKVSTEVALGGWVDALKAFLDFGVAGSVGGLASAFCAEITTPSGGMSRGTYAALELEFNAEGSGIPSNKHSVIYASIQGAAKAEFDSDGYFLDLHCEAEGSGALCDTDKTTGFLGARCLVNNVERWLLFAQ